jgi:hypothetical protein
MQRELARLRAAQDYNFCIELTFHSPLPTLLLPALTLSAGERKVIGGELKVG